MNKFLKTIGSLFISAFLIVMIGSSESIAETMGGIQKPQPNYTEYYYKAKENLNKKQFVYVSVSRPALFGLLNKHDDYGYFCNSKAAINTLKQQIINQKQLPATNSDYTLYNDEGEVTNTQISYPSTDTFTVHEPETGQDIVDDAQHSTGVIFYKMANSGIKCMQYVFIAIVAIAEIIVLVNIWKSKKAVSACVSDNQDNI